MGEERRQQQKPDGHADAGIRHVETREVVNSPVKVKHVDYVAASEPVDDIAEYAGIEKRLRDGTKAPGSEKEPALPDQDGKGEKAEDGERPDLTLEQPPGATPVLDIGQVENTRNDRNRRGALEIARGKFLDNCIRQNKICDDRKEKEEFPHFCPRSISLWHSMHVRTKGWFRRRGLRISWPHEVQTP